MNRRERRAQRALERRTLERRTLERRVDPDAEAIVNTRAMLWCADRFDAAPEDSVSRKSAGELLVAITADPDIQRSLPAAVRLAVLEASRERLPGGADLEGDAIAVGAR